MNTGVPAVLILLVATAFTFFSAIRIELEHVDEDAGRLPKNSTRVDFAGLQPSKSTECTKVLAKELATNSKAPLWFMVDYGLCPEGYQTLDLDECRTVACKKHMEPLEDLIDGDDFVDHRVPIGCFEYGSYIYFNPGPESRRGKAAQAYCKPAEAVLAGGYHFGQRVFSTQKMTFGDKGEIPINQPGVVLGEKPAPDGKQLRVKFENEDTVIALPTDFISTHRKAK